MQLLHNITSYLLDLLFPKSALVRALEAIQDPYKVFPRAKNVPPHSLILFDYKDENVRTLIWEIKYRGNKKLAALCAKLLGDLLQKEILGTPHILIPIPISKKRRRERGYNQTEIIAEAMLPYVEVKYLPHALVKTFHTESQARTHANKKERAENLASSMSVAPAYLPQLKDASIILLDDVFTSGATFTEAKRALASAGVKEIRCVALAH